MADNPFAGIESRTLGNGLKVWMRPFAEDRMVDVMLVIAGGSSLDPVGQEELAHFAEHVVFGDRTTLTEQALNAEVESLGGTITAGTSTDRTILRVTIPAEHAVAAIHWMARLVAPRDVTPALLQQQLTPILLELRAAPRGRAGRLRALYLDPPWLRRDSPWKRDFALDTPADRDYDPYRSLHALTARDVKGFLDRYYVPSNMTLVVAGGVAASAAWPAIDSAFAALPARPAPTLPHGVLRGAQRSLTIWTPQRNAAYARILRAQGLTARDRVLVLFLRDFLDKRLNDRLRYGADKLVYHPTVALALLGDAAILSIVATSDGARTERVRAIIDDEVARLRRGDAADAAFRDDRRAVAERARGSAQGREAIVEAARAHFFATAPHEAMPDMVQLQAAVTPADLAALLRARFPASGENARLLQPVPVPRPLLAMAALAVAWGALAILRRRLVVPVDLRRLRYVARLRWDWPIALAVLLTVGVVAAVVGRLLLAAGRPVLEGVIFPLPGPLQLASYALLLALGVWMLVLIGSRIPRKLLVFEDHVRLKFLSYRSVVLRPADIAECRVATIGEAWRRGRWRRGLVLTLGQNGQGLWIRLRDGRSLYVRSRSTGELRDALLAMLGARDDGAPPSAVPDPPRGGAQG